MRIFGFGNRCEYMRNVTSCFERAFALSAISRSSNACRGARLLSPIHLMCVAVAVAVAFELCLFCFDLCLFFFELGLFCFELRSFFFHLGFVCFDLFSILSEGTKSQRRERESGVNLGQYRFFQQSQTLSSTLLIRSFSRCSV